MPSIVRVILLALHASFLLLAVLASVNAPVPLGPLEVPRYIVTGAQGGTPPEGAAAPNRIEIHEFVKMDDHFSLYILTLQHMQRQDQKEVDSYFSIAGINGRPYQSWNGSGSMPVDPNAWQGYSQIGNVLFPTWQRVYLVLFEASGPLNHSGTELFSSVAQQALQTAAMKIAATYTVDQACFKQAALNLRQPYWDWSLNAVPPAEVIALKKVTIITPNGQKTHVDNPLYCYTFHPIDPSFPPPFSNWTTTLRQPSTNAPDAEDDVSDLRSVLRSLQSELRTGTYNLLRRVRSWEVLSNDNPRAGGSRGNNLEAIHDGVQAYVGGNGQISDPEVAAFDPIFFLHNCNVDRVLSLWSALNPGVWVSPGPPPHGSWTLIPKSAVDKDTDLTPFWKSQNSYWRSSEVTTTAAMGYTYPEFNGLNMSDPSAVRSAIAAKVVRLYA